ncbi:hypothetical protein BN2497_901 [Janthinobacterium sp. CG23_2]|nr:hypothetical protein BN2497_901 [Janthinobacterium sp. CG23_2]CUU26848.1 hypothetical protein BN3177_901 [Janthinobacterium sp. CG23_2]
MQLTRARPNVALYLAVLLAAAMLLAGPMRAAVPISSSAT